MIWELPIQTKELQPTEERFQPKTLSELKTVSHLTTVANAESYIYSSNGDISIQANTVDLNGLIYAPNGKVLISAGNIDFEGLIIADEIEVNGNDVTLSASPFNSYNIDFLTNIINDARIITVADYYLD